MRKLFSKRLAVWSAAKDGGGKTLGVGTHTFPFEFRLDDDLPSSFEDSGQSVGMLGSLVLPSEGFMPKSFGRDKPFVRYVVNAFVDEV